MDWVDPSTSQVDFLSLMEFLAQEMLPNNPLYLNIIKECDKVFLICGQGEICKLNSSIQLKNRFLFNWRKFLFLKMKVTHLYPTLHNPMDYTVHGIL